MINLKKAIIPMPRFIDQTDGEVEIGKTGIGGFSVINEVSGIFKSECEEKILSDFYKKACVKPSPDGYKIIIRVDSENPAFESIDSDEAYCITVDKNEAMLIGKSEKGAFYAAITLTMMAYTDIDKLLLPIARIIDYPSFEYRGPMMECRYGTDLMTVEDWKNAIDYFADMKLNIMTINLYNCWRVQYDGDPVEYFSFKSKKYPEIRAPKTIKYYSVKENAWHYETDVTPPLAREGALSEIIAYGKAKNVTIVPRVATLGHNTLLPRFIPEICAVDENGEKKEGGFCTSNPKSYEVLFDIIDEIIDSSCTPNGVDQFRLGFDEVMDWDECMCKECARRGKKNIFFDHIVKVGAHLRDKGIKRMVFSHDMLFKHSEDFPELKARLIEEDIYDKVVIGWWSYEEEHNLFWGRKDEVTNEFRSIIAPMTGYHNWSLIGDNNKNVRACARLAKKLGFEGIEPYTSYTKGYDKNYLTLADVSWNDSTIDDDEGFNERYAYRYYKENSAKAELAFKALEPVMQNKDNYQPRIMFRGLDYYAYTFRVDYKGARHSGFPGKAYQRLEGDKREECFEILNIAYKNAGEALSFFENSGSHSEINDFWTLTAKQYKAHANEYLTIYNLYYDYKNGKITEKDVVAILDKLIFERESVMALAETVRIPATKNTYLRNMSMFRQIMIDLRDYFKKCVENGERAEFDLFNWDNITGETVDFLR